MAQEFLIDRQFGQAIWIDVKDGIVQKCYNETPKFNARMNELYKGKTISEMKKDFKERMSGTVQVFHPTAITSALHKITGAESQITHLSHEYSSLIFEDGRMRDRTPAEKEAIKNKIENVRKELYTYQQELKEAIDEVERIHDYDCTVYRKAHLN